MDLEGAAHSVLDARCATKPNTVWSFLCACDFIVDAELQSETQIWRQLVKDFIFVRHKCEQRIFTKTNTGTQLRPSCR